MKADPLRSEDSRWVKLVNVKLMARPLFFFFWKQPESSCAYPVDFLGGLGLLWGMGGCLQAKNILIYILQHEIPSRICLLFFVSIYDVFLFHTFASFTVCVHQACS